MTSAPKRLALAALLVAAGFAAQAQTPPPPPAAGSAPMGMHEQPGQMDHARMHERMQERMQAHMQRRMERLKRILQIAPAQEGAWNAWAGAMRPSAQTMQRGRGEEIARLSTPERIDRMRQLRTQRNAEMDRRGDATKTFYAQLTPAQQKAFDEVSLRFFAGRHGHRHHGG